MAATKLFDQPTTIRLQALMESIRGGRLLLPEVQRPFVWSNEQRLELFDSILTGLPIGSLLIWRTTREVKIKKELEGFTLPNPSGEKPWSYVLDGQQRVFTLYAALAAEPPAPQPDNEQRRWPIFLDLEVSLATGAEGGESRFKLARRDREPPVTWLPLSAIFHPKSLLAYQDRLYKEQKDELAEHAEEVVNTFKDYSLALVPLITDDLALATRSFQRINSQGSRMDESHMLRALTYTENFDLTLRFDTFTSTLPWGRLDHHILVNTIKVLLNVSVYGSDLSSLVKKLRTPKGETPVLDQMEQGVRAAVEFLAKHAGIQSEAALPYAYQLVALANAAARGDDLNASAEPLREWLWATTYTEYFTGMTAGQLRRACEHVRQICAGIQTPPPGMPPRCSPLARFRWPSVRALAFMHMLARQPLVDEHGHSLDGAELLARGGETAGLLYPDQLASNPANRILVAPEHAAAVRRALAQPLLPDNALRKAHVLPPWEHPASRSTIATLEWRRARLRTMECEFIGELGLEVRPDEET